MRAGKRRWWPALVIAAAGACSEDEVSRVPDVSSGGTGGGWSTAGGAAGAEPRAPGVLASTPTALPEGEPTCCEHEWTIRALHYHPGATVPRRMYFSACDTASPTPTMYVSLALGVNAAHPVEDPSSGGIIQTRLDATGALVPTGVARRFPECIWMEGIATSSDCSTIGVLCRRAYGDTDYDSDALATHPDVDWMTQPDCADQEMWLYEWTNGDIQTEPRKVVLHRAVGTGWEYGNDYLRLGDDDTYGIGIKARVSGGGGCHEADAFLVLDRTDYHLTTRGWSWACGTGHTLFNHPTYNPATQKYAVLCGTDGTTTDQSPLGGLFMRVEDGAATEFYDTNYSGLRIKGGVGALHPLDDGGYLGVIVGVEGTVTAQDAIPLEPPTSIGLARFDPAGALVGEIVRVVAANRKYLSYPQLTPLGNGRYLFGYGEMYDLDRASEMNDDAYRIPLAYYVMEIDEAGRPLTQPQLLNGVGWGEQDQMVPLGDGRVGWAYIPSPALANLSTPPNCNSPTLQISTYTSSD